MTQRCNIRARCNIILLFALLRIGQELRGIDAHVQFLHPPIENKHGFSEPYHDQMERLEPDKDQILTVRLPSNTLLKYTSYKDVSILHFRVPSDTRTAYFTFKAFEESKSAFQRKCKVRDVTLHLKANGFPVISPENITFPKNFVTPEERFKMYTLQLQSDQQEHRINIQGPHTGSWFAAAFISWTDPNNDRIEQQGLSTSCDTLLWAELSVSRFYPMITKDGQDNSGNLTGRIVSHKQHNVSMSNMASTDEPGSLRAIEPTTNNENIYKFYVPAAVGVATAQITFAEVCELCPDIRLSVQANAFPVLNGGESLAGNEYNFIHSTIVRPNQTEQISIVFFVQPGSWHYVLLSFLSSADQLWMGRDAKQMAEKAGASDSVPGNVAQLTPKIKRHNSRQTEHSLPQTNATKALSTEAHSVSYILRIDFEDLDSNNAATNAQTQSGNSSEHSWQPVRFRGIDFYALLRQSYHEFFMFDFDLQPDANGTVPAVLNLTAQSPVGFAFEVGEVCDIGGTLSFAVSMKPELRFGTDLKPVLPMSSPLSERGGILAEKLVSSPDDTRHEMNLAGPQKSQNNQSMQIIVCMHFGVPGIPTWPDKCRYGQRLMPATSIVNNTEIMGSIHVPFPESGLWYVTMGMFCHGAETGRVTIMDSVKEFVRQHASLLQEMRRPCACADRAEDYTSCISSKDCLARMNETETLRVKECMMDSKCTSNYLEVTRRFNVHHKSATEQHLALDNCNTSVVFSVSSSPCVAGRCGRFGRCYHYMSGGFVFSTCVCMKGYRGWDCTEDSQVPSNMSILLASLLLTLSNLLFVPSIYLAFRSHYFTEGVIYFFTMFFSIFYHACDSGEDEYSFCLVKIGVLQFCDFYCGLLAIWVTLIAMAHVPQQYVSLLHMIGAILLAFGTELNKQSLWVFLAPALTGLCLISTSWGLRCAKTHKWFPARRYLTIYLPLGMVLVMIGLVCYAFLQTKQNYHIVHSIWHMVMALSIICLLPSPKSFLPKC